MKKYYYILIYDNNSIKIKYSRKKLEKSIKNLKSYRIKSIVPTRPYILPIKIAEFKRIVRGY